MNHQYSGSDSSGSDGHQFALMRDLGALPRMTASLNWTILYFICLLHQMCLTHCILKSWPILAQVAELPREWALSEEDSVWRKINEIHRPGWCLSVAALKSDVGIYKMIFLSCSLSLPLPKVYFNQVIASAMVAGNGAITDRPQGKAYQNWRLNFHKQKDHSCSLKPVTVLSTKSNLTRNTSWEPGSLWPQLWLESESSSSSCRAWINRANWSFST